MADLTANYNLTKPEGTENYSVPIVNANNDIIDTEIKARADEIAAHENRLDFLEAVPTLVPLTLATNFGIYLSSSDYQPGYRLSHGSKRVDLEGIIWRTGTNLVYGTSAFAILADLPAPIRPGKNLLFPIGVGIGNTKGGILNVNKNGTTLVSVSAGGTWVASESADFVSLAGVGWWIA